MRLLIIGDLNSYVTLAIQIARKQGADVASADTMVRALAHLRQHGSDLILIDARLTISNLVTALEQERISTPVIAYGTTADPVMAANSIRAGAREYLPFPPDPELIGAIIASISDHRSAVIARDPMTLKLVAQAEKIAASDASVLITGESGTGKEVLSRLIHDRSKRSTRPFISLNCAAIPETLLESELFGHEKGAFTGAVSRRIGKFEEAQGGTLLLDEISEMGIHLQAKLLRAIQERVIERLGGGKPVPVDIRIIATSNRNLLNSIRAQTFREDLYYRLNVVSIDVPPLRARRGDILPLSEFFIEKYCKLNGYDLKCIPSHVGADLMAYDWPGNVRELENIIHRAVLLSDGRDIQVDLRTTQVSVSRDPVAETSRRAVELTSSYARQLVGKSIDEVEQHLILSTLDSCNGNRTHAARILGISIRTLRNKLNLYIESGRVEADRLYPESQAAI